MTTMGAKGTKGVSRVQWSSGPFAVFVFQTPADKELYQWQIKATDRQVDVLVYELYGLTELDIQVVEATG